MYERDVSYIKRCQNYAFDVSVVNPAIDNRIAQMGRVYEGMVIAPSCPGPKCRKIPQLAPGGTLFRRSAASPVSA
jgi:hypothetical protein